MHYYSINTSLICIYAEAHISHPTANIHCDLHWLPLSCHTHYELVTSVYWVYRNHHPQHNSGISFPTKIKLYKSLVLSMLLYGCESWTLTVETNPSL